jgi:glycosyltransferase involved in cell wall biosynthesis/GT2 family glycosyltransferase
MRVCLVSREVAPFYGGGIGTAVAQMARVMAGAGHDVHILTAAHERLERDGPRVLPGVTLHAVDRSALPVSPEAYPTHAMRHAMAVYQSLLRLHTLHPFDYIEFPDYAAEGYFAIRAKRTLGQLAPAVLGVRLHTPSLVCREADRDDWFDREVAINDHMETAAALEADLVLAPSRAVLERLRAAGAGLPAERGGGRRVEAVVPLAVDLDRVAKDLGAGRAEESGAGPTVLFFGKVQHLKGVHTLLEAAQLLLERGVEARFRFIGNDSPTGPFGRSMLAYLRSRVRPGNAGRMVFEPGRPRVNLGAAIRGATVCCFPSLWDNFPMACVEAMALAAVVVVSDAGGLPEIVEDGRSGVVFAAGDAASLAKVLERVLGDERLRGSLSAAAPRRVRELCDPVKAVAAVEAAVAEAADEQRGVTRATNAVSAGPRVSVVIPYYNLGEYLPATLESVRGQTFTDYELIVVDDGSTDPASIALLERLERSGLCVLRKPNGGLGSARNAGFRAARGRWVLPLDADDLIDPKLLEKAVAAMERDPGLAYVSPLVSYFTDDSSSPHGGWVPLGLDRDLLSVMNVGGAGAGSLIDRQAALDAGGYDEWLTAYEDWDFWCTLAERGLRGAVIPEFLLHYRVRPNSMFRTEGADRNRLLRATIIRKHPRLALNPDRALRLQLAESAGPTPGEIDAMFDRLRDENVRYRIVDRINDMLKQTGVQGPLKGLASKALELKRRLAPTVTPLREDSPAAAHPTRSGPG